MDKSDVITFESWDSEISDGDLHILQVQYLRGDLQFGIRTADDKWTTYSRPASTSLPSDLRILLFNVTNESVYVVDFDGVSAFRVLDEHGLLEIWNAGERPNRSLFRVGGHSWTKESELSFFMSGQTYSWMIATGNDCVEVISFNTPHISFLEKIVGEVGEVPAHPDFGAILTSKPRG
jgi:hypothetical protein